MQQTVVEALILRGRVVSGGHAYRHLFLLDTNNCKRGVLIIYYGDSYQFYQIYAVNGVVFKYDGI